MEHHATRWRWHAPDGRRAAGRVELERRGVRHGSLERLEVERADPADLEQRFREGRPILLRGALAVGGARARAAIEASRRWFERLRRGEGLAVELRKRLGARRGRAARLLGISEDVADPLELEKAHVALGRGELYAKLSWVGDDEHDESLRLRFSFGDERSLDWRRGARGARAADLLAELTFPECQLISGHKQLAALLARCAGARVRLSERIVYNNSPGGGASFHHDAEPRQLGVVYGQMCGSTGWLALPRAELGELVARRSRRPDLAAPSPALERLLNRDPRLTRELAERGHFHELRAGDVLVVPSPSPEICAWHSVFALGRRASVAHSYGVFADSSGSGARAARDGRDGTRLLLEQPVAQRHR